jgi:hypothetical protein
MSTEPDTRPARPALRGQLFPEAYRSTVAGGSRELLPALRRWLVAVAGIVLFLLLLSIPVWLAATAELRAAVERSPAPAPGAASEPAGAP